MGRRSRVKTGQQNRGGNLQTAGEGRSTSGARSVDRSNERLSISTENPTARL